MLTVSASTIGTGGNSITTTESGAQTAWGGATLTGGVDDFFDALSISSTGTVTFGQNIVAMEDLRLKTGLTADDFWYIDGGNANDNMRFIYRDDSAGTSTVLSILRSNGTLEMQANNIEFASDLGVQFDHAGGAGNGFWLIDHVAADDALEFIHDNGTTQTVVFEIDDTTLAANFHGDMTADSFDLHPASYYLATPSSGVTMGTTEAQLSFDTARIANTATYTLGTNQITILKAGTYEVGFGVKFAEIDTTGGQRAFAEVYCKLDGTLIDDSDGGTYYREASGGTFASNTFIVSVTANQVLTLFGISNPETTNPNYRQDRTHLTIKQVGP